MLKILLKNVYIYHRRTCEYSIATVRQVSFITGQLFPLVQHMLQSRLQLVWQNGVLIIQLRRGRDTDVKAIKTRLPLSESQHAIEFVVRGRYLPQKATVAEVDYQDLWRTSSRGEWCHFLELLTTERHHRHDHRRIWPLLWAALWVEAESWRGGPLWRGSGCRRCLTWRAAARGCTYAARWRGRAGPRPRGSTETACCGKRKTKTTKNVRTEVGEHGIRRPSMILILTMFKQSFTSF